MRVDDIKRLMELVEQSGIGELEVRRWWWTVRISKLPRSNGRMGTVAESHDHAPAGPTPVPVAAPVLPGKVETTADAGLVTIASPMVGTVYRSPAPNSPPYVEEGGRVTKGQVICIVEAMKLMNEIESEVTGTVAKILVENGQPVEFNQPLLQVRPD